jgi:trimethylamine--corrinoid protein Co-methyltransferase
MGSLILGMLAGADLFGHAGILGPDHGGCLTWLVADNSSASFARRILQGMQIDPEHLALDVISSVGPGGNYLSEIHTVRHYRKELWLPDRLWTREPYDTWLAAGATDYEQRAIPYIDEILSRTAPPALDAGLEAEIDRIVAAAYRELA